jgi:hypothetical protein
MDRVQEANEVGLALRTQFPQLHHHQLLTGVQTHAPQQMARHHAGQSIDAEDGVATARLLSDQLNGKYLAVKRFGIYTAAFLVRTNISRQGSSTWAMHPSQISATDGAHRAATTAMTSTHSDTSTTIDRRDS